MLLLLVASMLAPGINYATPNQSISENFTNTTNVSEIVENTTNSTTIQNTTTAVVNDTVISQQENQTSDTSNNTQNSSSDNSNQTDTIQNNSAAASDGTYTNVHGIWLNVDDVNNVNVNELLTAGITDVFVKANRISNPTYQSVLTTIINKLQGTEIRIHAWITCFVDANGDWVDPKDSETTDALVNAITDITTNYNIAGIHLDYVRYPGTAYQYSGGTEAITSFVQRVYTTVKSIKAKVAVSAALMPEGAANAYYYGQDYEQLSNYLDFLVPMVYEGNYKEDNDWITSATAYIVNHSTKPVVVGLQTYKSDSNLVALSVEEINQDIKSALSGGASGFALFRYGWLNKDFFDQVNQDTTFTVDQIKASASVVRSYVESNGKLPDSVLVGSTEVTMHQFLELLVTATIQINNGVTDSIPLGTFSAPTNPIEDIRAGNILMVEYLKIANDVKNYMDSSGKTPDFAYQTSLGTYLRFENLVYMYSMILDYYNTSGNKAHFAVMKPWNSITTSPTTGSNAFTIAEIVDAAGRVKRFVETYHALPDYVQMGSLQVSMPQFLYLLTTCTSQLNSGITSLIVLPSVSVASSPLEQMTSGNLDKTEYVDLANRVKSFMDSNGIAPNYGSTSLGKLRFESLLYLYSRVVAFYGQNQYLPNYATMKSWSSVVATEPSVPAELQQYLQATTKCEVNDPRIIALAQSITSGATSSYQKATLIFNWVRDNINYSYYYDSQKGAVGTLTSGSANCCDHSHLVVALSRAAGLPARYVHGYCYFTSSGNWYGHVFAQIYVNGQWYNADATSSRNTLGVINNWNTNTWTYKGTYASLPF
ncbi:pseudomurein-binding repeat-containing protein [Methanobacterium formicicum]|uniref:pseudomurein-binding repeat-containing protein n=1 Tax=Methanobacterium formicicum TaxID=2162 RepID=UPI00244B8D3C|nr:pseudomurein-binding repeat-containing protein [Methanobacterium formicicum]MDH2658597.1 pseudomurein-binding repeat-containing protein [Methanobacterium formicicum]